MEIDIEDELTAAARAAVAGLRAPPRAPGIVAGTRPGLRAPASSEDRAWIHEAFVRFADERGGHQTQT